MRHKISLVTLLGAMLLLSLISLPAVAQTPTVLFNFDWSHGERPFGSLTLSGSTLYGMTQQGGANDLGVIFSITSSGPSTPTILFSFDGTHGDGPFGDLTLSGTTLYGMTEYGGSGYTGFFSGNGTIFSIPTTGGTPTVLFNFDGPHGKGPGGSLTLGGFTLYGTTGQGGANNYGVIFSIPTSGGTPTVLFNGTQAVQLGGNLAISGSTLYGTAYNGSNSNGLIFSIPTSGGSPTVLLNGNYALNPGDNLTLSGSTLYGMTYAGGNGYGTIFSIPTSGGMPTILFNFDWTNGSGPYGSLTISGSTMYGMTRFGGASGYGTIFSIPTIGGMPTVLFNFDDIHGMYPDGSLALSGSTLYGMTFVGGDNEAGTIFSIPISGGAASYTLTAAVSPSAAGTFTVSPSQATYNSGATVTITAYVNPGYRFVSWSVSGGTVASVNSATTSLTITGNCTLTAVYGYSGTAQTTTGGGTITLSSSGPYSYGQVITVTASAWPGYVFSGWSVTGPSSLSNSAAASTSLTVYSGFTLTAQFTYIGPLNTLFSFDGVHGDTPGRCLTLSGSTLYGMTCYGGSGYTGASGTDSGTIFSIPVCGGSPTILYSFDGLHGANPFGGLTLSGSTL